MCLVALYGTAANVLVCEAMVRFRIRTIKFEHNFVV